MAVGFDTALQPQVNVSVPSVTRAMTLSGSDRFLLSWALTTAAGDMSGVTYNGASFTKAGEIPSGSFSVECHYLLGPAAGTNNLVWTQGANTTFVTTALNYTGANQSYTPATNNTDTGTGTSVSGNLTTVANNSWIAWNLRTNGFDPNLNGTNWLRRTMSAGNGMYTGDTNGAKAAGANTMSVTISGPDTWRLFNIEIQEAAPATAIKTWDGIARANVKTLLGVASANIKTINGIT